MNVYIYIIAMAGVTYLVRMIPLILVNKQIQSRFLRSFLYYVPYACLTAMTIPAIFFATGSIISAAVGVIVAVILAFRGRSLLVVAAAASASVFIAERLLAFLPL